MKATASSQHRSSNPGIRHRSRLLVVLSLALVLGMLGSQDAQALKPHERDGVLFGVAFGFSPGQVSLFSGEEGDAVSSDWEMGVTPQLRLGYTLFKNRLAISVVSQQWLYEQGVLAEDKLRINVQNLALALNYYPGNPNSMAGGLHFEGGVGLANARITVLEPVEDDPHGNKFEEVLKEDEGGTSFHIGLGYEFRIMRSVAAGLMVSYVYQTIGQDIFDEASSVPVNFTLNWYW